MCAHRRDDAAAERLAQSEAAVGVSVARDRDGLRSAFHIGRDHLRRQRHEHVN